MPNRPLAFLLFLGVVALAGWLLDTLTDPHDRIRAHYAFATPRCFCEDAPGVVNRMSTSEKVVVLTLDACSGAYDAEMIALLRREKVPALLFASGRWIDAHAETLKALGRDPLFQIENHGLRHKPASIDGRSAYGIQGTADISELIEEIDANADRIEALTGRRPVCYRSGTAWYDDVAVRIANDLGHAVVNFDVVSGDVVYKDRRDKIVARILESVRPGSVIIMHMNHPEWAGKEALETVIPALRQLGYRFVLPDQQSVLR